MQRGVQRMGAMLRLTLDCDCDCDCDCYCDCDGDGDGDAGGCGCELRGAVDPFCDERGRGVQVGSSLQRGSLAAPSSLMIVADAYLEPPQSGLALRR